MNNIYKEKSIRGKAIIKDLEDEISRLYKVNDRLEDLYNDAQSTIHILNKKRRDLERELDILRKMKSNWGERYDPETHTVILKSDLFKLYAEELQLHNHLEKLTVGQDA